MQFCNAPGCSVLVQKGKCPAHAKQHERWRGSRQSRGYDKDYDRLRTWFMAQHENTLCRRCETQGLYIPATDCHHVVPIRLAPDRRLDYTNLEPLCHDCHVKADEAARAWPISDHGAL